MRKKPQLIKQRGVRIWNSSRRATPTHAATDAWFYENPGSIDIYIEGPKGTMAARISRVALADWLKRTAKKTKP